MASPTRALKLNIWRLGWVAALLGVYLLFICTAVRAVQSQPAPFDVAQMDAQLPLAPHSALLLDPTRRLTLEDVTASEYAARFVPVDVEEPNFGLSSNAVWVRFTLTNSGVEPRSVVFQLALPGAGYVDFFASPAKAASPQAFRTGAYMPFNSRPLHDRAFAFPVELDAGETQTYYLRVATDFALRLPLTIWPAATYAAAIEQETMAWNIVVGLVLSLSIYNMLVFLVIRDRDHLFLGMSGAISILTTYLINGFAAAWLGDRATHFMEIVVIMVALSTIAYVVLVISFLDLRRRAGWAYRILLAIIVVAAAAGVLGPAINPRMGFAVLLACTPILLVVTLIGTVIGIRQGYRPAIYFLVAQLAPIVLGLLQSTAILGFVPWAPPYITNVPLSELILIVLMSLALSDRINTVRKEAERANLALAASEARILDYLNALPFAVQVYSPKLALVFSNQTALHLDLLEKPPSSMTTIGHPKIACPSAVLGAAHLIQTHSCRSCGRRRVTPLTPMTSLSISPVRIMSSRRGRSRSRTQQAISPPS